jgi:hypothetical protein
MDYTPCWILDHYDESECFELIGRDIAFYQSENSENHQLAFHKPKYRNPKPLQRKRVVLLRIQIKDR